PRWVHSTVSWALTGAVAASNKPSGSTFDRVRVMERQPFGIDDRAGCRKDSCRSPDLTCSLVIILFLIEQQYRTNGWLSIAQRFFQVHKPPLKIQLSDEKKQACRRLRQTCFVWLAFFRRP